MHQQRQNNSALYTALVTPFKEEQIDEEGFEQLLHRQEEVDGVVLFGSTGEGTTLTLQEKQRLLKKAKNLYSKQLIVGVGCGSTTSTIDSSLWAEAHGAE